MENEDREAQLCELEALESVLREGKVQKTSDWKDEKVEIEGSIEIVFDSLDSHEIIVKGTTTSGEFFSNKLIFLPPVHLIFKLPKDYPSTSVPKLELESVWMTEELRISVTANLSNICEEYLTMPVLYLCYESIIEKMRDSQISEINLNDSFVLKTSSVTVEMLRKQILGDSEKVEEENFANSHFDCEVCFDSFMGSDCIKFRPCGHVFCKTCTFDYFRSLAKGVISKSLQCLGENCSSEAPQSIIKEALDENLFAKYEETMLDIAIKTMEDVAECPQENCRKVAYVTDRKTFLSVCSYCNFSFCFLCKQTYHGISKCKLSRADKLRLVNEYEVANEAQKEELYKKYGGEKIFKEMIERFLNDGWMDENSKPCPKCAVSIEKDKGCHKMHCTRCDTFFCWICNKIISKDNPYGHFQDDGDCSGRLFEGVIDEDEDEEWDLDADEAFDDGSETESDDEFEDV